MANDRSKAGAMTAIAQGMQGLTQGLETREQAKLAKMTAQQGISRIQTETDTGAMEAEVEALKAQSKDISGKYYKQRTFDGLTRYTADQNPKHLNATLEGDFAKSSGIVGFRKLNPAGDSSIYAPAGFTAEDFSEEDVPDDFRNVDAMGNPQGLPIHSRYVIATMQDGTEKLVDVFEYKKATGWFKDQDAQTLANETLRAKMAEPEGRKGWSEWRKKAEDRKLISGVPPKQTVEMLATKAQGGVDAGKIQQAEEREAQVDQKFDGDFRANFDPANQEHRNLAESDVEAIEKLRDITWSASELSGVQDMASLISLGGPDKIITDEETGLYDNTLFNLKKYASDEIGSGANEAYAAFRNSLRNALYGSALTEHEIAAFNEQLGSLKQQRGPLIGQMVGALEQVQAKLETIYNMQNSYVSSFRLGMNREKLAKSIAALKQNADRIRAMSKGHVVDDPAKSAEENRAAARKRIGSQL